MSPSSFVAVSTDGGVTFTAPRSIGFPDAGELHLAGGPPGVAYVVLQGGRGTFLVRTEDSGRTWSAPQLLSELGLGTVRLAAAGKRLIVTGSGPVGAMVWHSDDGGRHFDLTQLAGAGQVLGSLVEDDGTVWLYTQDMGPRLWKSTDGGVSFPSGVPLAGDMFFDTIRFGARTLFGAGKESRLMVLPLDDPTKVRYVAGLSDGPRAPRAVIPDRSDNVTVLDLSFNGLEARRLAPGSTAFSPPRVLGGADGVASGVALSERAVAVAAMQSGQVLVSVQLWP
jgi:hypothetical protein